MRRLRRLVSAVSTGSEDDGTPAAYDGQPRPKRLKLAPNGASRRFGQVVVAATALLASFIGRYWYDAAAETQPELGTSFSCRQATYLGENCLTVYRALLDDVGVRHVRLSLYWSDAEPEPGVYDFAETDELLDIAAARGADVLLTLGIKAQRYPEVYLPDWIDGGRQPPDDAILDRLPGVHDAVLRFDEAAVHHFAAFQAIAGWQVENEPFVKNFDKTHGWTVSAVMAADEVRVVRATDPGRRPIVVTHSSWTINDEAWKQALSLGDVLGQNVFTKKAWIRDWWYFFPYRMGPWVPDLPGEAADALRAGKRLWLTELQAEPEERRALTELRPDEARSMTARLLFDNLALARRSGARRVYFWGAEWWYTTRGAQPNHDLWATARAVFHSAQARSTVSAASGSKTAMKGSPR